MIAGLAMELNGFLFRLDCQEDLDLLEAVLDEDSIDITFEGEDDED